MVDAILGFFGLIFGWISSFLPENPFIGVVEILDDMRLGIGWLNWFVPLGEMLSLMALWLAAIAAVLTVKIAINATTSIASKVVGAA